MCRPLPLFSTSADPARHGRRYWIRCKERASGGELLSAKIAGMRVSSSCLHSLLLALSLLVGCGGPAAEPTPAVQPTDTEPAAVVEVLGGTFKTTDGVEIVYDLQGDAETTLVFVHCWACNRSFWKGQFAALSQRYRVLAMDLPGHGESGANRDAWTLVGLAEDVQALVEELDLKQVILVGHSMGGPVVALAAARMPGRVIGMVPVDTLHNVDMPWDTEALAPIVALYEQEFAIANAQFVPMMFPEGADSATVDWVIDNADRTNVDAAVGLMADFPNLDFRELLGGVAAPIRAVNAAAMAPIIPPTAIEANGEYADFDAVTLDGVGHYLMLEKPAEFNALLEASIQGIVAGSPDPLPDAQ